MKRPALILTYLILLLLPNLSQAQQQGSYDKEIGILEDYYKQEIKKKSIPGLSVGFIRDGFEWTEGFGYADLENRVVATDSSSYRLGSLSKPMVAVAILQLAEQGKLGLDDQVQQYVPYFPLKQYPVTIRQLLGHLGGITHYREQWETGIREHKDIREAIEIFAGYDLVAEPGTRYSYSSYGYDLLGAVVVGASGQPFYEYLKEHIWEPLGMDHTTAVSTTDLIPGRVQGYSMKEGTVVRGAFRDYSSRFGAGGIRSTVSDMLRFARGMMDAEILSGESIRMMTRTMYTTGGQATDYGMGWRIDPVNGHYSYAHGGGQTGTSTYMRIVPGEHLAMVTLCNADYDFVGIHRLYQVVTGEVYGLYTYCEDNVASAVMIGMDRTFNRGLAWYDRYGRVFTEDTTRLVEAFAWFNEHVTYEGLATETIVNLQRIAAGNDRSEGRMFERLGSYMAACIADRYGPEELERLHRTGALPFFRDYFSICRESGQVIPELRFREDFEVLAEKWAAGWDQVFTEDIRMLDLPSSADLEGSVHRLKKAFAGTFVYPDYSRALLDGVVRYACRRGDYSRAGQVAGLAMELYPASAVPYGMYLETTLWAGDTTAAKQWVARGSSRATVNKQAGYFIRTMAETAISLAEYGRLEQALQAMTLAMEINPGNAGLNERMGELYLMQARKYFMKSLDLNPAEAKSRKALKQIEDL